jgi:hypothetical protein
MNRGRQISNRDLERLSAYLDGALSAKEASRLESRLEKDAILQQALRELKDTTRLLSLLSETPLPRSFTLTPEMVGIRERTRVYPVMRLATALATFAFLLVVGVDAISKFALKGALAPVREEQVAMEAPAPAANAMETGEVPAEELDLEQFKMIQEEPGEVIESQPPAMAGEAEGQYDRTAPTNVLGITAETEYFAPEAEVTEAPEPVGTPTPAASGVAAMEEAVEDEGVESEPSPTLETQPTPFPSPTPTSPPARGTVPSEPRSILRVMEYSFGALAILLAGLTLWISRKD